MVPVSNGAADGAFLCGVYMFLQCMRGFSPANQALTYNPNAYLLG